MDNSLVVVPFYDYILTSQIDAGDKTGVSIFQDLPALHQFVNALQEPVEVSFFKEVPGCDPAVAVFVDSLVFISAQALFQRSFDFVFSACR
ncbi:MAG: hypothetical protein ACYSWR_04275 [Planctomycetota bacterium]|jgi:hypothetical protein